MTIRYTLEKADLDDYGKRLFSILATARQKMIRNSILCVPFAAFFAYHIIRQSVPSISVGALLLLSIAFGGMVGGAVFLFVFFATKAQVRRFGNDPSMRFLGTVEISITPEAFIKKDAFATKETQWSRLYAVVFEPRYIYIFDSAISMNIIPLEKLGEGRDAFVEELRTYVPEALVKESI